MGNEENPKPNKNHNNNEPLYTELDFHSMSQNHRASDIPNDPSLPESLEMNFSIDAGGDTVNEIEYTLDFGEDTIVENEDIDCKADELQQQNEETVDPLLP